ncbi:MAG TPA: AzlC family ABC transporter permease [Acidimicrobiia bacterium]|jgi:predicted branched-subunit amino acid permease
MNPAFRQGARDSAVIALAAAAFGVAYGVLAVDAGFTPALALFSSAVIVSGAAQFSLVGLLPAGPVAVLVAVTGLGLRHLPMSAKLAELIGPQRLTTRLRLAFILVDETFGLTVRAADRGQHDLASYKSGADLTVYGCWLLATAAGAWLGAAIDPAAAGVGVLFGLLFLGLAAPFVRTRRDLLVAVSAIVATLIAMRVLPSAWQLTTAAVVATLVGMVGDE